MDNPNYNDYMRNYSGYDPNYTNMYMSQDLERMYPDVYRVVYPMIAEARNNITMPITDEMIDRMTDDIYDRVQADGRINMGVDIGNEFSEYDQPIFRNVRQRPRRNRFFRDLIRILLLRELIR